MVYPLNLGLVVGATDLLEEVRLTLAGLPVRILIEQREIGDWAAFLEKVDQTGIDVLILGLAHLPDPLEDVVRQVQATHSSPRVIVVNDSAAPDVILRSIRAGAAEYIYPPLKEDLVAALERMSTEKARQQAGTRPRGKLFGFLSVKGGCGATSLACHVAVELHRQTKLQVLLADFDLDGGIIGFLMKSQCRYSLLDAAANAHRLDLSFWKALVSNGYPGVEVIMAPPEPGVHITRSLDEFRLVLPFMRSNYDWAVVDFGSGLSPLTLTVLEEVDELYLVTTLEVPSLHRCQSMVRTLLEAGYQQHRLRILLNRMPKRSEITLEEIDRMLGIPVYATIPNDYPSLYEAYADGTLAPPNSNLGKNYARVAAKMAGLQQAEKKKKAFSFLG